MSRRSSVTWSSFRSTVIVGKLVKEEWKIFNSAKKGLNFMEEWMAEPGVKKFI